MKKIILSVLLIALFFNAFSQTAKEKGLISINIQTAKAHIEFLAHDELQGREAGKHGSRIAAQYIISQLKQIGIKPLNKHYFQSFTACRKERQQKARYQVNIDSIRELKKRVHKSLSLNNILAIIEGENTNEYVIVGAHYDHLGIDNDLVGDKIYNGADDNASGVSAVLQLAKAFKKSGTKPKRNIIFAFWDGEEKGLLGSKYFTQTCPFILNIKGYLNYDMIGRDNNSKSNNKVTYFYLASHPEYEQWLKGDIKDYNLSLEPNYRAWDNPVGGSDNASFAIKKIPIIWYHTGGHNDYHQPSDHSDKINWEKLLNITKASYLNMWHWANDSLKN